MARSRSEFRDFSIGFHIFFSERQKGTFATQERIPDFVSLQYIKILPFLLFTTGLLLGDTQSNTFLNAPFKSINICQTSHH